jgi:hypothetical protein
MLPATRRAFFDELEKISSDLMTPAVVSDSATVDGPPPTPFTRRKGYRKLEKVGPVKEAGAKEMMDAAKALGQRGVRKAKRMAWAAGQIPKSPGAASAVLYHEIPKSLRSVGEAVMGDPGTAVVPTPFTRIFTG